MTDEPLAAEMDRAENAALLEGLNLIVASNRGPINFQRGEDGGLTWQRSGGGLVTALLGLAHSTEMTWVASALNHLEREWHAGDLQLAPGDPPLHLSLVESDAQTYDGYYNVIANPLLWFLQHSMWDFVTGPTITRETWEAWNHGYVEVNRLFAEELARRVRASRQPSLVMLQDYHLYLAPRQLRNLLRRRSVRSRRRDSSG